MILNLITPLFRSGMLSRIKDSIPQHEDINWIIILCTHRDILIKECIGLQLPFLVINAEDNFSSIHLKTNLGIRNMKDGFFYGLDDDTTFNHNCYNVFKKYGKDYEMIIGEQILQDGSIRPAQKPAHCYTDGGQALIHSSLLKNIGISDLSCNPVADCDLLLDCYNSTKNSIFVKEVISNYNFLR